MPISGIRGQGFGVGVGDWGLGVPIYIKHQGCDSTGNLTVAPKPAFRFRVLLFFLLSHSQALSKAIQKSMRLEYEPASEPLNIYVKFQGCGVRVAGLGG